jgi:hypothetical protein
MRAGPPFTDILVAARLILRDQQYTNKDQRRLMLESQEKAQKSRLSRRVILAVIDPKTLQSMQATNDACASNQVFSTTHP